MGGHRFDDLARSLGRMRSRRQMLEAVGGAMVGAAIGGAAVRAAPPPPLPPFPNVCSSPKSPPAPVTVTPSSANVVTGDCAAFNAFAASHGVTGADGTHVPNQLGITDATFATEGAQLSFPITHNKQGQSCATVAVSYPGSIHFSLAQSVHMLQWQPTPPPTGACLAAWNDWQQQTKAHEGRHVADNLAVLHALQQRWKTPRTYSACAATDEDVSNELIRLIDNDLQADAAAAEAQAGKCRDLFHKTPAGAPGSDLDCSKCCKDNTPSCGGKCCENGLVCSTSLSAAAGIHALVLASDAECVCPNGHAPALGGGCQQTGGGCPVGSWQIAQLHGALPEASISQPVPIPVSWQGSFTLTMHADQTYAFAYDGFELDVSEAGGNGQGVASFNGGSDGSYSVSGTTLTIKVLHTTELMTTRATVAGQAITIGPNPPSAVTGTDSFFLPGGAYTFACGSQGGPLALQGPTGVSYGFRAVSNQQAMAPAQRSDAADR